MKICKGDLFESKDTFKLITTNAFIKKDGTLVMGAGAAKFARDSFSGIDLQFGNLITMHPTPEKYGVIISNKFGAFQVKYHFKDLADLELIKNSCEKLKVLAIAMPLKTFSINFPGIGNGKRTYEEVLSVIESCELPDNITFWIKE